jgi:hypothetical protein
MRENLRANIEYSRSLMRYCFTFEQFLRNDLFFFGVAVVIVRDTACDHYSLEDKLDATKFVGSSIVLFRYARV